MFDDARKVRISEMLYFSKKRQCSARVPRLVHQSGDNRRS